MTYGIKFLIKQSEMQDELSEQEKARVTYEEVNAIVSTWPKEMQLPVAESMGDATIMAVVMFCSRNPVSGIDIETKKKFTILLTDEFRRDEERGKNFPYKHSYIWQYVRMLHELAPVMKELWERGEKETALKLARTVCFGETLKFLDDHLDESRAILNGILKQNLEVKTG